MGILNRGISAEGERGKRVGYILYRAARPAPERSLRDSRATSYYAAPCLTRQGDCVAVIAQEVSGKTLREA